MASTPPPQCVLDHSVLNADTVGDLTDMGLSLFAPLCGKNRGAFVTDPPDGHTYGCLLLPPAWSEKIDLPENITVTESNDIKEQFAGGNLTATDTVDLLNHLTKAVYQSTSEVDSDPYACDAGGLAGLECSIGDEPDPDPIRSVTLAGLFVPFMGEMKESLEEAVAFYTPTDFADMKTLGLNTVQIPVALDAFEDDATATAIETVIAMAHDADLDVIVTLVPITNDDVTTAVIAAANFCIAHPAVTALTLPEKSMLPAVRDVAPDLMLFVRINAGDYQTLEFSNDENVFGAIYMDHSSTVADVASSDILNDRMKLFYHEAVACVSRSPLEFAKCIRRVPVLVSGGFDISIDDCVKKDYDEKQFHDYGQCERFDETLGSGWWDAHRASFAARQVFAYERGMGWSYTTWKLNNDDDDGVLDTPAKLLALKNVAAAGLFPVLNGTTTALRACLNPPMADFVLGDDTLAPSEAPPPDCGEGWWNFETKQCDYWIPPSAAPSTLQPTVECPVCDPPSPYTIESVHHAARNSGLVGGLVGIILGAVLMKVCGKKEQGYSTIPN